MLNPGDNYPLGNWGGGDYSLGSCPGVNYPGVNCPDTCEYSYIGKKYRSFNV